MLFIGSLFFGLIVGLVILAKPFFDNPGPIPPSPPIELPASKNTKSECEAVQAQITALQKQLDELRQLRQVIGG